MAGIGDWWKKLDPKERTLIAIGVPAVAAAALFSALKKKPAAAPEGDGTDKPPQVVVTGAPTYGDGGSSTFDLYRNITAYLDDLVANGGVPAPTTTTPTPSTPAPSNPCLPGSATFNPAGCSDSQLMSACNQTGGDRRVLQELYSRRHSVNDPAFGGPANPTACGRQYVLYLLERGVVPA